MKENLNFSKIEDSAVAPASVPPSLRDTEGRGETTAGKEAMADKREEIVGEAQEEEENIKGEKIEKSTEKEDKKYNFELFEKIEPDFISLVNELKEDIDKNKYNVLVSDEKSGRIPTLAIKDIINKRTGKALNTYFVAGPRNKEQASVLVSTNAYKHIAKEIAKNSNTAGDVLIVSEGAETGETLGHLLSILENDKIIADIGIQSIVGGLDIDLFAVELGRVLSKTLSISKDNIEITESAGIIVHHKDHQHQIKIGDIGGKAKFSSEPLGVYKNMSNMEVKSLKQKMKEWENRYHGEDLEKFKDFLYELKTGKDYYELKKEWEHTALWEDFSTFWMDDSSYVSRFYDDKTIQENIKKGRDDIKLLAEKALQKVWVEE